LPFPGQLAIIPVIQHDHVRIGKGGGEEEKKKEFQKRQDGKNPLKTGISLLPNTNRKYKKGMSTHWSKMLLLRYVHDLLLTRNSVAWSWKC